MTSSTPYATGSRPLDVAISAFEPLDAMLKVLVARLPFECPETELWRVQLHDVGSRYYAAWISSLSSTAAPRSAERIIISSPMFWSVIKPTTRPSRSRAMGLVHLVHDALQHLRFGDRRTAIAHGLGDGRLLSLFLQRLPQIAPAQDA